MSNMQPGTTMPKKADICSHHTVSRCWTPPNDKIGHNNMKILSPYYWKWHLLVVKVCLKWTFQTNTDRKRYSDTDNWLSVVWANVSRMHPIRMHFIRLFVLTSSTHVLQNSTAYTLSSHIYLDKFNNPAPSLREKSRNCYAMVNLVTCRRSRKMWYHSFCEFEMWERLLQMLFSFKQHTFKTNFVKQICQNSTSQPQCL